MTVIKQQERLNSSQQSLNYKNEFQVTQQLLKTLYHSNCLFPGCDLLNLISWKSKVHSFQVFTMILICVNMHIAHVLIC